MTITVDKRRFVRSMKTQAEFGATEAGGLHRLALSDADKEVRDWFYAEMEQAGLAVRVDEIGNMFGRRDGEDNEAPPILLGSHLDSASYGGRFDGALGVIAALECIRTLNDEGIHTHRPVEIVNWTNEEGARFQPGLQGSGVWVGDRDLQREYARTDANGITVESELERIGYMGETPAEPGEEYDAYLELHIEQGPYLEERSKDVGVVTGIVGLHWGTATFRGRTDHAGGTPMHYRKDAFVAAVDVASQIRRLPSALGDRTVATVGHIEVEPNQVNIIPGSATIEWDLRDPDDAVIDEGFDRIQRETAAAAEREGVAWEIEEIGRSPSVEFPERCVEAVDSVAGELGYDSMRIFSGGGHDATYVSQVCDTGMLFSVSEDGISHAEDEFTSWDDCYSAANTLASATLQLANSP